jgi:hypothetical protein
LICSITSLFLFEYACIFYFVIHNKRISHQFKEQVSYLKQKEVCKRMEMITIEKLSSIHSTSFYSLILNLHIYPEEIFVDLSWKTRSSPHILQTFLYKNNKNSKCYFIHMTFMFSSMCLNI